MLLSEIVETVNSKLGSDNDEWQICCPFCSEQDPNLSEDTRFHLGVNVKLGLAHCFRCHWRSKNPNYIAKELCRAFGLEYTAGRRAHKPTPRVEQEKEELLPIALPNEFEPFRFTNDLIEWKALRYLETRGVTTVQIIKHGMGYCAAGKYAWRVIIPVYGEDSLIYGFVGRDFSNSSTIPYLNSEGCKLLWNGQRKGDTGVLVEGIPDGLAVERAFANMPSLIPVSNLGSSITKTQLAQLKKFKAVVLFPDWDKAGVGGSIQVAELCIAEGIQNVKVVVPERMTKQDPDEIPQEKLVELVLSAKPYSKQRLRAAATKRSRSSNV